MKQMARLIKFRVDEKTYEDIAVVALLFFHSKRKVNEFAKKVFLDHYQEYRAIPAYFYRGKPVPAIPEKGGDKNE